jgi:hypothetical protein
MTAVQLQGFRGYNFTDELAKNYRLSDRQISSIRTLIEAHANEFRSAWTKHFGG